MFIYICVCDQLSVRTYLWVVLLLATAWSTDGRMAAPVSRARRASVGGFTCWMRATCVYYCFFCFLGGLGGG